MRGGDTHLSIDIGASSATAVLWTAGQHIPVMPDGQPRTPSGVFVDPDTGQLYPGTAGLAAANRRPDCYLTDPLSHLATDQVAAGPRTCDPLDLVAAVLRHHTSHAAPLAHGPITALTMTVPAGWGPRRRQRLQDAAARASLPAPRLVTAPAAIAAHLSTPPATVHDGACVLVCQAGGGPLTLTVLQHTGGEYRELATTTLPDGAETRIVEILARRATHTAAAADADLWQRIDQPATIEDQQARWHLLTSTRHATETLATQPRAAVLLPEPNPPAVIDHADLTAATRPLLDQLPTAVHDILTNADVDPTQLHHVILTSDGTPPLPGLHDTLTAAAGRSPTVITAPYATADGALLTARHPHTTPTAAASRLPRTRLRISDLTGFIIIGLSSAALLVQAVTTADIRRSGFRTYFVRTVLEHFGAAGTLAALAALAVAHLAPTTWLTGPPLDPATDPSTGTLIRRAYTAAAAVGITVAAMYGLAAGTYFGLTPTPYLRWSLTAAAPITVCALLIAVTAPRIAATDLPAWLHRARPAVLPIALAVAGILLMRSALTYTPPTDLIGYPGLIGRVGAAALGVATALTVTGQPFFRAITAPLLALGYTAIYGVTTANLLTIGYLLAITWWTAVLTAATLRTAYPTAGTALRRLIAPST